MMYPFEKCSCFLRNWCISNCCDPFTLFSFMGKRIEKVRTKKITVGGITLGLFYCFHLQQVLVGNNKFESIR